MEAMTEIKNVISTFSVNLERAIQTEVRRQMLEQLDLAMRARPAAEAPVKPERKQGGPKVGSKATPKPCPT